MSKGANAAISFCAGVKLMLYIICLIVLTLLYIFVIAYMKKFSNTAIMNAVFIAVSFISYITMAIIIYCDVGFNDWNFHNTFPTANVSPFMFFTLPIYSILPSKAKKTWSLLISLLSLGMFFAVVLGCIQRIVIHYKFHLTFLLDHISHLSLSLLGVYLVKSNQVELKIKESIISGSILVAIASIMLIINAVFGTAFFGLALNSKYNIYNMVLVDNCYLSALLYFVGMLFVLTLGYFYQKILNKRVHVKVERE